MIRQILLQDKVNKKTNNYCDLQGVRADGCPGFNSEIGGKFHEYD